MSEHSQLLAAEAAAESLRLEVARLTADLAANARLLAHQSDLAREAEAEAATLRGALSEVQQWRQSGVGLVPMPTTDPETLGQRIDLALASSPRAEAVGAVVEAARAYRTIARLRFPVASASAPGLVQAQRDICDASDALRKALDALDAEVPHA